MKQNPKTSYFSKWLDYLKDSGATKEEITRLVNGFSRASALNAYIALMSSLTKEDIAKIEAIKDDKLAEEEMKNIFSQRTGMTIEQLVGSYSEDFSKAYMD